MQNPRHTSDAQIQSAVPFFEGVHAERVKTSGATIYTVYGGNRNGPPLLLLHGIPETHVLWRKVAPALMRDYFVVMTDLRGYGDSSKPPDGGNHSAYSKRAMAQDQVDVMRHLGFAKFALVGHDRAGARHIDWRSVPPTRSPGWSPLTSCRRISSTNASPRNSQRSSITGSCWFISPAVFNEYLRTFGRREALHAICEDYRAAASVDLAPDAADLDKKIQCPLLVLWSEKGPFHRMYDVLETWRSCATEVQGEAMSTGHFLPEQCRRN